jgi:tRNA-dihydrouridine synthase B
MEFLGFQLRNNLFVAPMAGVTDRPFRQLCKRLGAGLAVSEMVTSNSLLYGSAKTRRRANHEGEVDPISVQIAGADPAMMAEAARYNADEWRTDHRHQHGLPGEEGLQRHGRLGADAERTAGRSILEAVVAAVPDVPVTLKFRTGWNRDNRNAPTIARIAEGIRHRAIAIHGRTRADQYRASGIRHHRPGQVAGQDSGDRQRRHHHAAEGALRADYTGADGVMIGRAAQGGPGCSARSSISCHRREVLAPPKVTEIHASCAAT